MTHQPRASFAHYSGSRRPSIVFVGEAFGESEAECGRPFAGQSGKELFLMIGEGCEAAVNDEWHAARRLFYTGLGWIGARDRWAESVGFGFTNVLAFRPPDNKIDALAISKRDLDAHVPRPLHLRAFVQIDQGRYLGPQFLTELDRLAAELSDLKPNLVVALGNIACWALLGSRGIAAMRGTTTTETLSSARLKVLPTYHPAGVMRNWSWRQIVVGDLVKATREAAFREVRRPSRQIVVNPTLEEVEAWTQTTLTSASPIACDIETSRGQITMVGFADSSHSAIVIPFRNFGGNGTPNYWTLPDEVTAWCCVRELLLAPNQKVFQNGLYDIQYFMAMGLRVMNAARDTMLLHHSIIPEMQKGLGFLGSVYTDEPAWKLMRRKRADEPEKADE